MAVTAGSQPSPDFSDARDAARLALLCIDTALSADTATRYTVASLAESLDREGAIGYLENLSKPVVIHAERHDVRPIELRVEPQKPIKGVPPLDLARSICETHSVEESGRVLVRGEDGPEFTMRIAGISLWQDSYYVAADYIWMVNEPDDSARAAGAIALVRVGRLGPGPHFSTVFLR